MRELRDYSKKKTARKDVQTAELDFLVQKEKEREAALLKQSAFAELERRYTSEDLVFAWQCGYDSRVQQEHQEEQ